MQKAAAKHSLIVGLGATGAAVARYLAAHGERVRVIDSRAAPPGSRSCAPRCRRSTSRSRRSTCGGSTTRAACCCLRDLPYDLPLAVEARRRGLAVIGDIELFALAARAPVIAVTGSNGKSTVTTLASKMLESQRLRAPAGGNLGPPALDLLEREADAYVLEISSFQMETTDSLAPLAATVLNVSADHLDRHGTLEIYAELKEKLLTGGGERRRQRRRSARRGDGRTPRAFRAVLRAERARARLFDRRAERRALARARRRAVAALVGAPSRGHAQRGERARRARRNGRAHDGSRRCARSAAELSRVCRTAASASRSARA